MASLIFTSFRGSSFNVLDAENGIALPSGETGIMPVTSFDEQYAESTDSEGGFLVSSHPQNPQRSGKVLVIADDASTFQTRLTAFQGTVDEIRAGGGMLTYLPPQGGSTTFTLVSATITDLEYSGVMMAAYVATFQLSYTARPYGLRETTSVVTDEVSTDPLLEFDVPALEGSVDALALMTITDSEGQARYHLEGGMESRYYDPVNPWALLIDESSMAPLESATETTRTGSYSTSILRQTLGDTSTGIASASGTHVGRFRVKGRFYGSAAGVEVQLAYGIRGSGQNFNDWVTLPGDTEFDEVDLGVINIEPPITGTHSVQYYVYAKSATGSPTVDLDWLKFIPAERYFKAHGAVGSVATIPANGSAVVRHDAILTETDADVWARHPNAVGSYLRIPAAGGRIAIAVNRADIETEAHTPLGDEVTVNLDVTPRVILL